MSIRRLDMWFLDDGTHAFVPSTDSKLTPRVVRQKVEQELELDPGTLDEKEYKEKLKPIIQDAVVRAHLNQRWTCGWTGSKSHDRTRRLGQAMSQKGETNRRGELYTIQLSKLH